MKKQNLYVIFIVIAFTSICTVYGQSTALSPITLVKPSDCTLSQYYDISRLNCANCPANSARLSNDYYNCRCNLNYYFTYNNGGGSIGCAQCTPSTYVQSLDGFSCVSCTDTCLNCGASGFTTDSNQDGSSIQVATVPTRSCITCDPVNSILSDGKCVSCKPFIFAELETTNINTLSCSASFLRNGGILIADGSSSTDPNVFNVVFGSDTATLSVYYQNNLIGAFRTCRSTSRRNATGCQVLGNMCVLNLYNYLSSLSSNIDPCKAFNNIPQAATSSSIQNQLYGTNMPWLQYPQAFGAYTTIYETSGIGNGEYLTLTFDNKCVSSTLSFVAAEYSLNGKLNSFGAVDISKFQLCNFLSTSFAQASQVSPFSATNYQQTCTISAASLLTYSSNPLFYDLYLKYSNSSLFPVPVKVLNYLDPTTSSSLNRLTDETSSVLHRRFFLAEAVSSIYDSNLPAKYVRYVKAFTIRFSLVTGQTNGRIYPPLVILDYDHIATSDLTKEVTVTFNIEYRMNLDSQILGVWIAIGVLCFLSFLWAVVRTWSWNRRAGLTSPEILTLFKFIMFLCSGVSSSFLAVVIGWSIYWLIFYKGQSIAFVVIPLSTQEESFRAMVIVAAALKAVDIIHLILVQSSYDIFFIDWERPRVDQGDATSAMSVPLANKTTDKNAGKDKEKLIKDDSKEYNKVSCWRTIFAANEWNELQTFRKINPTVQLVLVLFFLKVVNLEAFTTSDCNTSIVRNVNLYQAPYSGFLRVGMASSMYLAIGLLQYIIYLFFYIRCIEDKISQFVDFCSVANISMFIMTHTQYGYYIHGRSPHGNADTSMQQMALSLLKEQEDLTTKRGLENSDDQTYSISVSDKLSKQYAKVMTPIYEKKVNRSGAFTAVEFEKRMIIYAQLNRFLMAFIDNILRDMRYVRVKRNFLENILDVEFKEPRDTGYFYADQDKTFTNALFCGNEIKLFAFDLSVFLIVDYFANNYILAAFIVYVVMKIYNTLRNDLGKRNISRKTLVDKRFLI